VAAFIVRHGHKLEDNIKPHLKELEWKGVIWIYLTQDRGQVAGCWEDNSGSFLTVRGSTSFCRRNATQWNAV